MNGWFTVEGAMTNTIEVNDEVSWIDKLTNRRVFGQVKPTPANSDYRNIRINNGQWVVVHISRLTKECG